MKNLIKKINQKHLKIAFIIFCACIAIVVAYFQQPESAPDEGMKMDVCRFIADYGQLPHGGDERIRNPLWGISYGFTPILSYMVGAIFVKIALIFTQDEHLLYFAARLTSCICYTIMVIFTIKIGDKLFKNNYIKWLFVCLISLLPQVVFLGSYINNDSLALMSISIIIYSWICGIKDKWSIKSCIMLAIGIAICALSYYNSYGFILTSTFLYLATCLINKISIKEIIKKGLIISLIVSALAGWWFIRNAVIYDGDFLGMATSDKYNEEYAIYELKASNRLTPDRLHVPLTNMLINQKWIVSTVKSFIGVFGSMDVPINTIFYYGILGIYAIGIIGYLSKYYKFKHLKELIEDKNKIVLEIIFVMNIVIPIILSVYYSYYNDFQAQGRYIMPMLIPLIYFITLGYEKIIEKLDKIKILQIIMEIGIMVVILVTLFVSILKIITVYTNGVIA